MNWSNEDPREAINKRKAIVVVDAAIKTSFLGTVETKHAYCVFLNKREKDEKDFIAEDAEWPSTWYWAPAPEGF